MPVQGARAISRLTRFGKGDMRIAAIMRPCEIRATIELLKLEQVDLGNVTLIGMDCPGALPLSDFIRDPEGGQETFKGSSRSWDSGAMREVCKVCEHSSMMAGDLHIGTLGADENTFFLIPNTKRGEDLLDTLGHSFEDSMDIWQTKVNEVSSSRKKARSEKKEQLMSAALGPDGLLETFSRCINCHNCMRVCPICYCQLCYFDSDNVKHTPQDYLQRAESSGSLRCPPDTVLFHMGRMMHMSLSCVSCGTCEDACPMSIPVAQIFSMVGDETQALFDYVPGSDRSEPLPLSTFKEEELKEVGE